jgi:ABC-type transport system involved in multi-copper enzyme maturation permease subunit
MTPLERKEIRLLFPSFVAASALAVLAVGITPPYGYQLLARTEEARLAIFFVGAALIGLAPFGQEYTLGTFSIMLSQPVSRRRLWSLKAGLAGVALALMTLLFALSFGGAAFRLELIAWVPLIALVAFAGGLWTTIVFRHIGAAFLFTILTPYLIVMLWNAWALFMYVPVSTFRFTLAAALVGYSATTIVWARRRYLEGREVDVLSRKVSLATWRERAAPAMAHTRPRAAFTALVIKELALHQISFLVAGGLMAVHLCALAMRSFGNAGGAGSTLESVPVLLWLLLPWIVGAMAVADERKQGTLIAQFCLPVSRGRQYAIKLAVALALGWTFGCVAPLAVEGLGHRWLGASTPQLMVDQAWAMPPHFRNLLFIPTGILARWTPAPVSMISFIQNNSALPLIWSVIALGSTLLAFFVSSLARHTLHALVVAFVIGPLLAIPVFNLLPPALYDLPTSGPLAFLMMTFALASMFVICGFANYRTLIADRRLWIRNAAVIVLTLVVAERAAALIYLRPWERFMTLEPPHGPALLSGSTRPRLCGPLGSLFALLPDGRIWGAQTFSGATPTSGTFFPGSQWTDIACHFGSRRELILGGLREDGSLWYLEVKRPAHWDQPLVFEPARRLGSENDWKAVFTSASDGLVAQKIDGTLWRFFGNSGVDRASSVPEKIFFSSDLSDGEFWLTVNNGALVWSIPHFAVSPGPSSYSDWLATSNRADSLDEFTALAADGTVCAWREQTLWGPGLLGPSERPHWCLNILAIPK